jgi:hypothetical protein
MSSVMTRRSNDASAWRMVTSESCATGGRARNGPASVSGMNAVRAVVAPTVRRSVAVAVDRAARDRVVRGRVASLAVDVRVEVGPAESRVADDRADGFIMLRLRKKG